MTSTTSADDKADAVDIATRLTQIGDRTSLMVIDSTLRLLPGDNATGPTGLSNAAAAQEVRELARRMLQATRDFQAAAREPAGEAAE
ncbi:hypothetical protein D3877_00555 [Azospirillum cavernae]|jgi:RecA/RadA recombinase|uniref:Uncharacterized protein n=1 Tax=Azospirillum cavernae TaxID=2320860 RepID=A0A418VZM7_9PROT|nr:MULTISPECIES: hypothetical protein [Azospirillum]RJF83230.1 hypothetical protein D3877_00555 [Azospirillum cavernae]